MVKLLWSSSLPILHPVISSDVFLLPHALICSAPSKIIWFCISNTLHRIAGMRGLRVYLTACDIQCYQAWQFPDVYRANWYSIYIWKCSLFSSALLQLFPLSCNLWHRHISCLFLYNVMLFCLSYSFAFFLLSIYLPRSNIGCRYMNIILRPSL